MWGTSKLNGAKHEFKKAFLRNAFLCFKIYMTKLNRAYLPPVENLPIH